MRPWDITNDKLQYESEYVISTWTKHRTPVVRTLSITSLEQVPDKSTTTVPVTRHSSKIQRPSMKRLKVVGEESGSSAAELDQKHDSDSSEPGIRMYITKDRSVVLCPVVYIVFIDLKQMIKEVFDFFFNRMQGNFDQFLLYQELSFLFL